MERKQLLLRMAALVLVLAAVLLAYGGVLYDLQIVKGEDYAQQSVRRITDTEAVAASRGSILDSYGRVLVSNRTTYQVELDTAQMGDARNDILLRLLEVCREEDVAWNDGLADILTVKSPAAYLTADPFRDGEGELTWLGEVAEEHGWLEEDGSAPAAGVLLDRMRETYELDGDLTDREARELAGVFYALDLRKQELTWSAYVFAQDVDIDFITKVKERGLTGVDIEATSVREYNTPYAAHLLGRVGPIYAEEWEDYRTLDLNGDGQPDYQMDDTVGKDGAEQAFERYLRGSDGVRIIEKNTSGKTVNESWRTQPVPGGNVALTIDIDLQAQVEQILADGVASLDSEEVEGAAAVMIGVDDGAVLAMASYPTFDLASYGTSYNDYVADPLKPLFNRALQGQYAPGSTFKMVTAVAGLEEGIIEPDTRILDTGVYTYYGANGPRCWIYNQGRGTHGLQTVSQAIQNSCNVFFYDVGRQVGISGLQRYAAAFGLGEPTGIELFERTGIMAGPEYTESMGGTWYDGSTLSVAIGQESSQFTPVQLANYIATLANGGTRYQVHLLQSVKSYDFSQVLYEHEPVVLETIDIAPENLEAVKKGMLAVTTQGSAARYFADLDFQVGAKTGSAQLTSANTNSSNAVFVCFAPYDDPEVALALVVEKGGSGALLGSMAADILDYYFSAADTQGAVSAEGTLIR